MGEQSASRLGGDDYQHLYSWYELLQLLDEESKFDHGYVEHPEAGAADDVTLTPKAGIGAAAKFVQVKWHVDYSSAYTFDSLVEVVSGKRSLLEKLFLSWKKLHLDGPVELWLVSNWSSAPHPDLGAFVDGTSCALVDAFFEKTEKSAVGKYRESWRTKLAAPEADLEAFFRSLRLRLGYGATSDFEERVDDRMAVYGLRRGPVPRSIAVGLVRKWITQGGEAKRVTAESLRAAIHEAGLLAAKADQPKLSLWIHGWTKRAYDGAPTVELDWTSRFDLAERRIPNQETWDSELLPSLEGCKKVFIERAVEPLYVDFRGKLPLTASLAVGSIFPEVAGFSFRAEQPTHGELHFWQSSATATERKFVLREEASDPAASDVLVVLNVTGRADADVKQFLDSGVVRFKAVIFAEPDNGPGDGALQSDGDAVALAIQAKTLVRGAKDRFALQRIHLVPYAPASFCLFLGQRLNALGDVVTYERGRDGGYQASVVLHTR